MREGEREKEITIKSMNNLNLSTKKELKTELNVLTHLPLLKFSLFNNM